MQGTKAESVELEKTRAEQGGQGRSSKACNWGGAGTAGDQGDVDGAGDGNNTKFI